MPVEKLEPAIYHKVMNEIAEKLNSTFGCNLHPLDDYKALEIICKKMKLKFTKEGKIL